MSSTNAQEVSIHAVSPLSIFDAAGAAATGELVGAAGAAGGAGGGVADWARTVAAAVNNMHRMPSARVSRVRVTARPFNFSPLASLPTRRYPSREAGRPRETG